MKIILINPPTDVVDDDRLEPPLGLLYLASNTGLDTDIELYDMSGCANENEVVIKTGTIPKAHLYGIGCFSTNYQFVRKIVSYIRGNTPNAMIVAGGPHPTALPGKTLADLGVDAVVCGEGEDEFARLAALFSSGRTNRGVFYGQGRKDIDTYAAPAHHLVDYTTYSRRLLGEPVLSMIASRGCIHKCLHCNSVVMGGGNRSVRYRSPGNVVREMERNRDAFRSFRFNDDHFTGNPNLIELLDMITPLEIKYRIFARVEDLEPGICKALSRSGCRHISVGLESLNPRNLRFLGKGTQIGKESGVRNAKEYGITVRASFMVGLPDDNDQTIEESFTGAAQLGLDEFAIYPLIPYPGTTIAQSPGKFGYTIVQSDYTQYVQMGRRKSTCFALKHTNFSQDDVRRWIEVGHAILSTNAKHMRESTVAS